MKILCACIGNSDRSPLMAAVLGMFLKNAGHACVVESAGIGENAATGGPAAPFAIAAAKRIGLDLSGHKRRRTNSLDLKSYDLIVCASDEVAGQIIKDGGDMKQLYNAQITNPWPVPFEQDYERTAVAIMGAMYLVVARYFPNGLK